MKDIPRYTISSKRMFDKCPAQYEYRYIKELDSVTLSDALSRGITFHEQAEGVHSPDKVAVEQKGYAIWATASEELTPIRTEFPIEVNLDEIQDYIKVLLPKAPRGKFAGVVDLLAQQKDGTRGLVDHKSTLRFYDFPILYSTEQLYMYYMATHAYLGDEYGRLDWVCLSRVKVEEDVPYAKARAYMISYLKRAVGPTITAKFLTDLTKSAGRAKIKYLSTCTVVQENSCTTVQNNTLSTSDQTILPSPKKIRVQLNTRKQGPGTLKCITIRDDRGYITSSIFYTGGTLVHVERQYFTPSQEELRRVGWDFLTYVRDVQAVKQFRRAPGLHCSTCPFREPCEEERRMPLEAPRMTQDEILTFYPSLAHTPPHQEVHRAIQKAGRKLPAILP